MQEMVVHRLKDRLLSDAEISLPSSAAESFQ